jgi:hypothetical protein
MATDAVLRLQFPAGSVRDIKEIRRLMESGSPLVGRVAKRLLKGGDVFFVHKEYCAAGTGNGVSHLQRSEFFTDLLATLRALHKFNSHSCLRGEL